MYMHGRLGCRVRYHILHLPASGLFGLYILGFLGGIFGSLIFEFPMVMWCGENFYVFLNFQDHSSYVNSISLPLKSSVDPTVHTNQ